MAWKLRDVCLLSPEDAAKTSTATTAVTVTPSAGTAHLWHVCEGWPWRGSALMASRPSDRRRLHLCQAASVGWQLVWLCLGCLLLSLPAFDADPSLTAKRVPVACREALTVREAGVGRGGNSKTTVVNVESKLGFAAHRTILSSHHRASNGPSFIEQPGARQESCTHIPQLVRTLSPRPSEKPNQGFPSDQRTNHNPARFACRAADRGVTGSPSASLDYKLSRE